MFNSGLIASVGEERVGERERRRERERDRQTDSWLFSYQLLVSVRNSSSVAWDRLRHLIMVLARSFCSIRIPLLFWCLK